MKQFCPEIRTQKVDKTIKNFRPTDPIFFLGMLAETEVIVLGLIHFAYFRFFRVFKRIIYLERTDFTTPLLQSSLSNVTNQ